jgi:large subunit ribosomal protein L2
MSLKYYKATTPSHRERVSINYKKDGIWRGEPLKILTAAKVSTGGRNNKGRTTSFHKGLGHKKSYRIVDFKRKVFDVGATVLRIEYDPNRSAYIALISYDTGDLSYILGSEGLKVGDIIYSSFTQMLPVKSGNVMPLKNIPLGTTIHNIEIKPGYGGQLARSAGSSGKLVKKDSLYCLVRLSSGRQISVLGSCLGTIGITSKIDSFNQNFGKAGRSRWLGIKPTVRGVVMNPIDHPHGGGEGKTSGGRCSVTPWGLPTKGYRTNRKKYHKKRK